MGKIRRLPPGYSSPYGRVHNPNITTKPKIYIGEGTPLSYVCAGHMEIGPPECNVKKAKKQLSDYAIEKRRNYGN